MSASINPTRITIAVGVLLVVANVTTMLVVLERQPKPPPFSFDVEHGRCQCAFDDDTTSWDFGRNRERIKRTVCIASP